MLLVKAKKTISICLTDLATPVFQLDCSYATFWRCFWQLKLCIIYLGDGIFIDIDDITELSQVNFHYQPLVSRPLQS